MSDAGQGSSFTIALPAVAIDLRFVIAVLKIDNDLERIGDLAPNIAEHAPSFPGKDHVDTARSLPKLGELTQNMVRKNLDAVVNMDARLARDVQADDDDVDTPKTPLTWWTVRSCVTEDTT